LNTPFIQIYDRVFAFIFFASFILFSSCDNSINVTGPFEEKAVVYALLDASQPLQFVKINKVFTNPDGNALAHASVADSLYFDTISPILIEEETGRIIPLSRTNVLLKDSGIFATYPNYMYSTNEPLRVFVPGSSTQPIHYRLEFHMPKTGKLVSARTNMVAAPLVLNPRLSIIGLRLDINPATNLNFQLLNGVNGRLYDGIMTVHYEEMLKSDTNQRSNHSITWKMFSRERTDDDEGKELLFVPVPGIGFFISLEQSVGVDPNVQRRIKSFEFRAYCANSEFATYLNASEPSIGIVQKQSDYSNIVNGVGFMASRTIALYRDIKPSTNTINYIRSQQETKALNFIP
jgi:hypothetical protein